MTPSPNPGPSRPGEQPLTLDPDGARALREALVRADYSQEALDAVFGLDTTDGISTSQVPRCLRRAAGDEPLPTLARLFRLAATVPATAARDSLAPLGLDRLEALGLVRLQVGEVAPHFRILASDGQHFVCDLMGLAPGTLPPDHVTGINGTSLVLDNFTVRRPSDAALDLGTGCGFQALRAARHARRVVATDLNRRALNLTAFNALLNGLSNVECRHGSLFEPVAGETFDLIVCNPPFVISPESRYLFRDGGQRADSLCEQLVRSLPAYLKDGGLGHVLGNWALGPDEEWPDPPRRWLRGRACNVLALLYAVEDPLAYATRWLESEHLPFTEEYSRALDLWSGYLQREGMRQVATGGLVVQRRAGARHWFQGHTVTAHARPPLGEHVGRIFQNQEFLNRHPHPGHLLDCRFRLHPDHRLNQVLGAENGAWSVREAVLGLSHGLGFRQPLEPEQLRVLAACDGQRTLRELLLKEAPGDPFGHTEWAMTIHHLVANGLLVPSEES